MMIYDTDLILGDEITDVLGVKYTVDEVRADKIIYRIESEIKDIGNLIGVYKRHEKLAWISMVTRNRQIIYSAPLDIDLVSEDRPF